MRNSGEEAVPHGNPSRREPGPDAAGAAAEAEHATIVDDELLALIDKAVEGG